MAMSNLIGSILVIFALSYLVAIISLPFAIHSIDSKMDKIIKLLEKRG